MAEIPVQKLPTVRPAGATGVFQDSSAATSEAFGAAAARGLGQLGQAIGQGADVIAQNVIEFQRKQNIADAEDTYANKFSPEFRDEYQKYYALQGKEALDQLPAYTARMQEIRQRNRGDLPNEESRRLFDQISRRRVEMELDGMARYADQQHKVWRGEVFESSLKVARDSAADKYNDEHAFGTSLGMGQELIERFAIDNYKSAEWVRQKYRSWVNDVAIDRIGRMLADDKPFEAQEWYRKNIGLIDAQHRPAVQNHINAQVKPMEAKNIADGVVKSGMQQTNPQVHDAQSTEASDALINAQIAQESAWNPTAVSPKGAMGLMQLKEGTARDMASALRIPFDKDKLTANTPEGKAYNQQLGRAYMNEQLRKYSGNQSVALAAYNAGPGTVDKWLAKYGDPTKGEISTEDWVKSIPYAETRDYVSRVNAKAVPPAAKQRTSVDIRDQLADMLKDGKTMAEIAHPNDPVFADMVSTNIHRYVSNIAAGYEAAQRKAHGMLVTRLNGDNGKNLPTEWNELTNTPELKAAASVLTPESVHGLLAGLRVNQNVMEGKKTSQNYKLMQQLRDRMDLDANDPNLIWKPQQLTQYIGEVGPHNVDWLRKDLDRVGSETGKGFNARISNARYAATQLLKGLPQAAINQGRAYEAAIRWEQDVMSQVEAMREAKSKQDVNDLFNPKSPKYILNEAYVKSFMSRAVASGKPTLPQSDQVRAGAIGGPASTAAPRYRKDQVFEFKQGTYKWTGQFPDSPDDPRNFVKIK